MKNEDKWPLVHTYRRAVENGDAPAVVCPDCDSELVTVVTADEQPAYRCYPCNITFYIGSATWNQMESNIREIVSKL